MTVRIARDMGEWLMAMVLQFFYKMHAARIQQGAKGVQELPYVFHNWLDTNGCCKIGLCGAEPSA